MVHRLLIGTATAIGIGTATGIRGTDSIGMTDTIETVQTVHRHIHGMVVVVVMEPTVGIIMTIKTLTVNLQILDIHRQSPPW